MIRVYNRRYLRFLVSLAICASLVFQPYFNLTRKTSFALADDATDSADIQDNLLEKADIIADGADLLAAIERQRVHELDIFRLLVQKSLDFKKPAQFDVRAIVAEIYDQNGVLVTKLNSRELNDFKAADEGMHYLKLSYQGNIFFTYTQPVTSVAFLDSSLAFTEAESANLDHIPMYYIDLKKYQAAIGETRLPIFTLPIARGSKQNVEASVLSKDSLEQLTLAGVPITSAVLAAYSDPQELAFNISVNLTDPEQIEKMAPVLSSLESYFVRAAELRGGSLAIETQRLGKMNLEQFLSQINRTQKSVLSAQELRKKAEAEPAEISPLGEIDKISKEISDQLASQKKLLNRVRLAWGRLSAPQPKGAPSLMQAMALVGASFSQRSGRDLPEALRHIVNSPSAKTGLAIASGYALASVYPQEVAAFFYQSLDITRTVLSLTLGKVSDFGQLGGEAIKATFAGFNPIYFHQAYLTPERLPKLAIGLTAVMTTLYLCLGIPHLITNSYFLIRDLKNRNWSKDAQNEKNIFARLKIAFIDRQNQVQENYEKALSQATQGPHDFTPDDDEEVARILASLEAKERRGLISRWLNKARDKKQMHSYQITTVAGALRHFLFSFATFTISGTAYTQIWNSWFAIRSFIWNPEVVVASLLFPNYWSLATKGIVPSRYNGGQRHVFQELSLKWTNPAGLKALEAWEDHFLAIEAQLSKMALRKAFADLSEFNINKRSLDKLMKNGPPEKITDETVRKLSHENKMFFRHYYDRLMEAGIQDYMNSHGITEAILMKNADTLTELSTLEFTAGEASLVIDRVSRQVKQDATEEALKPVSLTNFQTDLVHKMVSNLDGDNNRQVKRMQAVNKQAANPKAMARAVRSMVASNIVDKPLELMFTFLCLAGITSGVLAPIQEEMFSENSWFHLSRMVFSNGFIYGVISGVLADVWMKLQQDELHEGHFEDLPDVESAKNGFLKHYVTKLKDPKNSLWKNQRHYIKIVVANLKAAFTTILVVNLVTMGRLDLDAYIVGYLFTFFVPISGFAYKLEQAFEMATGYFAKDIPEKYHSHRKVQTYLNQTIAKKRLWFNLYYKTYENIVGYLIFNFQQMKTVQFGSRSFSRIILGGYTWTELGVAAFEKAGNALSQVPGAKAAASFCAHIISNNYTDFEKITPKK